MITTTANTYTLSPYPTQSVRPLPYPSQRSPSSPSRWPWASATLATNSSPSSLQSLGEPPRPSHTSPASSQISSASTSPHISPFYRLRCSSFSPQTPGACYYDTPLLPARAGPAIRSRYRSVPQPKTTMASTTIFLPQARGAQKNSRGARVGRDHARSSSGARFAASRCPSRA